MPIIKGMIDELRTKVDPLLGNLSLPPCMDSNKQFTGCTYHLENERRVDGSDCHDACPLWQSQVGNAGNIETSDGFEKRKIEYGNFWGIDLSEMDHKINGKF